jgi:hypothetical protein
MNSESMTTVAPGAPGKALALTSGMVVTTSSMPAAASEPLTMDGTEKSRTLEEPLGPLPRMVAEVMVSAALTRTLVLSKPMSIWKPWMPVWGSPVKAGTSSMMMSRTAVPPIGISTQFWIPLPPERSLPALPVVSMSMAMRFGGARAAEVGRTPDSRSQPKSTSPRSSRSARAVARHRSTIRYDGPKHRLRFAPLTPNLLLRTG